MQAVILAAGESSRFWPLSENKHKSLIKIMGKPLIEWTIESLVRAGIKDIIIIQSPDAQLEKYLKDGSAFGANISYLVQKEAKGMGNAIALAEPLIKEDSFFVLNPYVFNAEDFLALLSAKQKESSAKMVLLGVKTDSPWNYGMLGFKDDRVVSIIEKPLQGQEPSDIKATNIYLLPKDFFGYYIKVEEKTYAFEDALSLYMKENDVRLVISEKDTVSLKYPWDLFKINEIIMNALIKKKRISKTAKIAKSAIIEGPVWICDDSVVFEHAVIKGPVYIGKGCTIGNNAILRKYVNLEEEVLVGANAEVTRSIFQPSSHIHSGFFGDSIIGSGTKIGAGAITANARIDREEIKTTVKGKKVGTKLTSLGAIIGDDARLGTAVNTMPGILIGANSKIGPNSLIRENVPSNTTYYTEFKNVIKKNNKTKEA